MALFETKATRREKERQHDLELARINARARVESEKYSADANEAMYRFKREELLSNNRQKVQEQIDDLIRRNPIDMILSLIKLYQQNTDAYVREYDGKSEKIERSNEAKIILAEIQTYKVPTERKSFEELNELLLANKDFLRAVQKDKKTGLFLGNIMNDLNKKMGVAYDKIWENEDHEIPLEEQLLINELSTCNESKLDDEQDFYDMIKVYETKSIIHPYGKYAGTQANVLCKEISKYVKRFNAPTSQDELEEYIEKLNHYKGELEQLGKQNPLIFNDTIIGLRNAFGGSLYDFLMKKAKKSIKANFSKVQDGSIGSLNQSKSRKNKILLTLLAVIAIIILLIIVL